MSITIRRPSAVFHSLKELPQMADLPSPAVYKADETQQASLDTTVETTVVALAALIPPQVNTFQRNWRFCPKLWFNGYPTNGRCAAGGGRTWHMDGTSISLLTHRTPCDCDELFSLAGWRIDLRCASPSRAISAEISGDVDIGGIKAGEVLGGTIITGEGNTVEVIEHLSEQENVVFRFARLAAGGRWIRTFGSPRDPLPF